MADKDEGARIVITNLKLNMATVVLAITTGGGVYYGVNANQDHNGDSGYIDNQIHNDLKARVVALETSLSYINSMVSSNHDDLRSRHNKHWNLPDQVVFADTLQEYNPDLKVPTPRVGR